TRKAQSRAIKVVFDYSLLPASVVPNVRAAAQQRLSHPPSSGTSSITWQPVSPASPIPDSSPTSSEDFSTPTSSPAAPPPSEVVSSFIAPDETQETGQAQVDENGPDTVVVRNPKYTRPSSRIQQPDEIVQADHQPQEETPGEPGT